MITIILHDQHHKEVARAAQLGNEKYLITEQVDDPRYPLLEQLDDCSYTVFGTADMPQVISELEAMKSALALQQSAQVDEIIALARECQRNEGYTLIFTAFGAFPDEAV